MQKVFSVAGLCNCEYSLLTQAHIFVIFAQITQAVGQLVYGIESEKQLSIFNSLVVFAVGRNANEIWKSV